MATCETNTRTPQRLRLRALSSHEIYVQEPHAENTSTAAPATAVRRPGRLPPSGEPRVSTALGAGAASLEQLPEL